jgi:hypothetical protein
LSSDSPWDKVYFRLSSSAFRDDRWNHRNFARQRARDALSALKWLEQRDMAEHNAQSISTAKLCMVVMGALGGKNTKATVDDFLPFDTRKIKKDNGITSESLQVLRRLMKTHKLDGRLLAVLADDLKATSNREEKSQGYNDD